MIRHKRSLLASLWTVTVSLSTVAFVLACIFTLSAQTVEQDYYYDDNPEQEEQQQRGEPELAVTSRAMVFAAVWTLVLATLLGIFGAVVLGWHSPYGVYYVCCAPAVHKTTPLTLGTFMGSLFMFCNFTIVCAALFGEYEVSKQGQFVRLSLTLS